MRSLFAIILMSSGALFILANFLIVAKWYMFKRPSTTIPLIGGLFGMAGMLLLPNRIFITYCWLPLILDLGCLPLCSCVIIDRIKKRLRKSAEKENGVTQ